MENNEKNPKKEIKKQTREKKLIDFKWIVKLSIVAFIISLSFSLIGQRLGLQQSYQ